MNKIEHELKWSIESNYLDGFFFNSKDECIRELDIDAASKKCFELLEKHSIGFGEFLGKYPDKNRNYKGEILHAESKYDGAETTEELFKLYCLSL